MITLPLLALITGVAGATVSTVVLAGPLVLPAGSWATALTTVPLASGVPWREAPVAATVGEGLADRVAIAIGEDHLDAGFGGAVEFDTIARVDHRGWP